MSPSVATRSWCTLLLAGAAVVLGGCQVHTTVAIDVRDDGSGQVEVSVALDEEAARRVPQLADQLEVDDLVASGWTVTGPSPEDDGRTWIRASKPFSAPEQAGAVLAEVTGPAGPFRDLEVRRRPSLVEDRWELDATVDLRDGLAGFSDDALRERLDGTNVGLSDEEVAAEAGRPLAEAVTFEVAVVLPGEVTGNGAATGSRTTWQPLLGERVDLVATGTSLQTTTLAWFATAGTAVVALVVLGGTRAVRGRRRRGRHAARTLGHGT